MKNRISRLAVCFLLAALMVFSAVEAAFALNTSDAVEPIDTSKPCSLKLTYRFEETLFEGLEIAVYRFASVSADYQYSMAEKFSEVKIAVNGIKSQSEWEEVAETVGSYVTADSIEPDAKLQTNAEGVVFFENLLPGIYYVLRTDNAELSEIKGFAPFMIAVPGLGEDGKWIYDVEALPKPGEIKDPPDGVLHVTKEWKDGSKHSKRPDSVAVEIFKNGESFAKVTLSDENNWSYEWESNGTDAWVVVEREIPSTYTVTVTETGSAFLVTNTAQEDDPPPVLGDTFNATFWIFVTSLSGVLLIVCGLLLLKRKEKED